MDTNIPLKLNSYHYIPISISLLLWLGPFTPLVFRDIRTNDRMFVIGLQNVRSFFSDARNENSGLVRNFSKIFFCFCNFKKTTSFQQCMIHYYLSLVTNALVWKGSRFRRSPWDFWP